MPSRTARLLTLGILGGGGAGFTYYVDSVTGSDAFAGTSPTAAFATLGAVPALTDGQSVGLARGSTFRNQKFAAMSANNLRVGAYGSGDRPVVDGSITLSSGGWTKTGGLTSVYQRAITFDAHASGFIQVFENNAFLVRATSAANADAAAGSYYTTSDTAGSATLYIHATGSGDPASNGKVYDLNATGVPLMNANGTGMVLSDIVFQRCVVKDGPVYLGRNSRTYRCDFKQGARHNVIVGGGAYLEDCAFTDAYFAIQDAVLFVCYQPNHSLADAFTLVRCIASNLNSPDTAVSAYLNHGSGAGDFGRGTYIDCQSLGCLYGWSGTSLEYVYTGCTADDCDNAISMASPTTTSTISGLTVTNCTTPISLNTGVQTVTITDSSLSTSTGVCIVINPNGCTVDVQNTTFNGLKAASGLQSGSTGLTLTSRNNTFVIGYPYYSTGSGNTMDSDYNQFEGDQPIFEGFIWDNVQYWRNFASYKLATGFDAHSTLI